MFYLSGRKDSQGRLGVVDSSDNIEEFYTKDYLLSLGIEIIRLNKELEIGFCFEDAYFYYELIDLDGVIGWNMRCREGIKEFKNSSSAFGYPVISLFECFKSYTFSSIDVSGMDTSNVITMQGMFSCCSRLVSLNLSNFDTKKVTNMISMFDWCGSLKSLDLSSFVVTSVSEFGLAFMFMGCTDLLIVKVNSYELLSYIDKTYNDKRVIKLVPYSLVNKGASIKLKKGICLESIVSKLKLSGVPDNNNVVSYTEV